MKMWNAASLALTEPTKQGRLYWALFEWKPKRFSKLVPFQKVVHGKPGQIQRPFSPFEKQMVKWNPHFFKTSNAFLKKTLKMYFLN